MARRTPTPVESFLAPLAGLAEQVPEIEALVFWGGADGWDDTPTEALEAEEMVFYAEGLLEDGFHMVWTVVALAGAPQEADHVRLQFWQDGGAPPPLPHGWLALGSDRWVAA